MYMIHTLVKGTVRSLVNLSRFYKEKDLPVAVLEHAGLHIEGTVIKTRHINQSHLLCHKSNAI